MNKRIVGLLHIWLVAFASAAPAVAQVADADVAVVVNSNNPMATLSLGELRKIFAGEKRTWPAGSSIKLIVRAPGTHERLVLMKLLGMSEGEYKQYWTTQVFRGEASSEPVVVFSNGMEKEAVVAIPGAIALMEARDVKPGIKVIKVDGLMPGSPGYPLH
jgi:ABC-type phosphate transport system substrate-binding protein